MQDLHDIATRQGAVCAPPKSIGEDAIVHFGDNVKATTLENGDIKLTGYLVRFGDETKTDLTGDYFTKNTDFGTAEKSDGWFNHRMPVTYKGKRVQYDEQLPDVKLTRDDIGVFAEIVIGAHDEYEKAIADLGVKGKLGWSSGTAPHLVDRKQVGQANEITRWRLGLDASLTPTPAESRNKVVSIKSLTLEADMDDKEIEQEVPIKQENKMTELNEESVKAMFAEQATSIKELVKTEAESAATKAMDNLLEKLPEIKAPLGAIQVTQAEEDRPFKSIGENLLAIKADVLSHGNSEKTFPRMRFLKATGASEGVPQDGGYLLEPTVSQEILKPMHEAGPFSSQVRKLPVGNNSNSGWINGVDETSRATGSRWGGIRGYRLAEAQTKPASKPSFRRIQWELKKYAAVIVATDELLQDAPMFGEIVRTGVGEEFNFMLNDDIMNGVGLAGPQGFMQSDALITVTRDSASKILGADISAMYYRMDLRGRNTANWYISNEAAPQLDNLFAVGSTAVLYPYASITPNGVKQLYGRPIITTEFAAPLNTTGDISFFDPEQYLLWEKGGVQAQSSIHVYFLSDETAYRFVTRVDGKLAVNTPLTPYKGTVTTSPAVTLSSAT